MQVNLDEREARPALESGERMRLRMDEADARLEFSELFDQVRSRAELYPREHLPSATFEAAARMARSTARKCLPFAVAVAMHLYPFCAIRYVPLPLVSLARMQRALLLRTIEARSLVLANAGSERSHGPHSSIVATAVPGGILLNGRCEYMSLASVADIVLVKAEVPDHDCTVLCAADLQPTTVRIGPWKLQGRMQLSDTAAVTFTNHFVPRARYSVARKSDMGRCIFDYQRCWFQLFLAEIYLARSEHLRNLWNISPATEHIASLNDASCLRAYSLHLLDDFASLTDVDALSRATSALKLRVSFMVQATAAALLRRGAASAAQLARIQLDASELQFIRAQPTADEKIVRDLGARCGRACHLPV